MPAWGVLRNTRDVLFTLIACRHTGYLLYQNCYFMQMLEGERAKVLALMERVKKDPHHRDPFIVTQDNTQRREFQDWDGVPGHEQTGR